MGESIGKGFASNSSTGADPCAREGGEDQAYLSLDPVGLFGTDGASAPSLPQPSIPAPPIVPPTQVASPFGVRATELDSIPPARPARPAPKTANDTPAPTEREPHRRTTPRRAIQPR